MDEIAFSPPVPAGVREIRLRGGQLRSGDEVVVRLPADLGRAANPPDR